MPSRPNLPPPGTPAYPTGRNSLRGVAQELAAAAQGAPVADLQGPIAGIAGPSGLQLNVADAPRLAVFQIVGPWYADPVDSHVPQACAYAKARQVYYFAEPGTWQVVVDDQAETYIYHPCGYQLDSVDPDRGTPGDLQAGRWFMPKISVGQWAWCHFDPAAGIWQVLEGFEDIVRVRLLDDWYACGRATAQIQIANGPADEWLGFDGTVAIDVYDPLGVINNDVLALETDDGEQYIPAGTFAYVKRFADNQAWEPLRFMPGECPSSSSSSSSGSSGSSSSSGSSGSSSSSGTPCHGVGPAEAAYPGYDAAKMQMLVHVCGCFQWVTIGDCGSSGSSGSGT